MDEEVNFLFEVTQEKMNAALRHLETELSRIRAGKANPHILDGIDVEYYGNMAPLSQVSNISTPDGRTIAIQPWEKNMIGTIEKAIMAANIGLTPANNGEIIRLNIPPLTEERRLILVKQVKNEGELAKVSIRNCRRDANEELKTMQKDGLPEDAQKTAEAKIQEMTNKSTEKVDKIIDAKEVDIMTV
ncbi:MAG: ribosome recycling factor [Bacteroidales bacterium]|nr:ribosome recycling factor [Bacteroidales bacterium]MCF8392191.1 ribosome recycling factor [Bacteroidales bacterium]